MKSEKSSTFQMLQTMVCNWPFVAALSFTMMIYALEEYLFNVEQTAFLITLFVSANFAEQLMGVSSTVLSFLLFFAEVWVSLLARKSLKIVCFCIFSLIMLIQYGYYQAFRRFISSLDILIAFSEEMDVWYTSATLFFNPKAFLPIALYLIVLIATQRIHDLSQTAETRRSSLLKRVSVRSTSAMLSDRQADFKLAAVLLCLLLGLNLTAYYIKMPFNVGGTLFRFTESLTEAALGNLQSVSRATVEHQTDLVPDRCI